MAQLDNKFSKSDTVYYNYNSWNVTSLYIGNGDSNLFDNKVEYRYRIERWKDGKLHSCVVDEDDLYTPNEIYEMFKVHNEPALKFKIGDIVRVKSTGEEKVVNGVGMLMNVMVAGFGLDLYGEFREYVPFSDLEYAVSPLANDGSELKENDLVEFIGNGDGKIHKVYAVGMIDDYKFAVLDEKIRKDRSNMVLVKNLKRYFPEWSAGDKCYSKKYMSGVTIKEIDYTSNNASIQVDDNIYNVPIDDLTSSLND